MALFSPSQITWDEPYFFVLRLRTRKAWAWRGLIALAFAALFFIVIKFFDQRPRDLWQTLGVSALAGVVLTLLPDAVYFQRNISIDESTVSKDARIWPVGPDGPRLSPPLTEAVAFLIALGPLAMMSSCRDRQMKKCVVGLLRCRV